MGRISQVAVFGLSVWVAGCGGSTDGPLEVDATAPRDGAGLDVRDASGRADRETRQDAPLQLDGPAQADGSVESDDDHDGIPETEEQRLAEEYFPYVSLNPDELTDGCPLNGVIYRLRPHPDDPNLVSMIAIILYQDDCTWVNPHVGDNEAFALTIDPSVPAPAGILTVRAIPHFGTVCAVMTECGADCPGLDPCTTATRNGVDYPVVFASWQKHGNYVFKNRCDGGCFMADWCNLSDAPLDPPLVNVGEPDYPLIHDLTTEAFITPENGWTKSELYDFDPWGTAAFGGAGTPRDQLTSDELVTSTCE